MPRIRGTGIGTGMAIGTAAIIRERNGLPMPPPVPERIALLLATHRLTETPEIVLISRDYTTALALSGAITWARVAAIASETAPQDSPVPPFPAVVNLAGIVDSVRDDVLVLVDATNNFVFPDPDPMYLAQYTAEHDRVAPKRRLYLDEGHYPAQTLDGHTIQVFARIDSPDSQIETAMAQGADGLFVAHTSSLHTAAEAAQRRQMFGMIHEAAGKPLIIADIYRLPATLLCEASVEADITLASPYGDGSGTAGIDARRKELERVENTLFDSDVPASVPRMAALVVSLSQSDVEAGGIENWVESVSASGAARVVFSLESDTLSEGVLVELEQYLSACARCLLPTYVSAINLGFNLFGQNCLENTLDTAIELLLGAGVSGVIVDPANVGAVKTAVGEMDSEACKERYWSVLTEARS